MNSQQVTTNVNIVQVMYGSHSFRSGSSKVSIFRLLTDNSGGKEFPNCALEALSKPRNIPAAKDGYEENGCWYQSSLYSKSGIILAIQASTSIGGATYNQGVILIYLRESAPLIKVGVHLTRHNNGVFDTLTAFTGRGDILSYDDSEEYGLKFNKYYTGNFFNREEIDELFTIETLSKGSPKPEMLKVKTPEGEDRLVPTIPTNRRRIRIRR